MTSVIVLLLVALFSILWPWVSPVIKARRAAR